MYTFEGGPLHGVMYTLLISMSAHVTRQLGMAPGGEFRMAYKAANQVWRRGWIENWTSEVRVTKRNDISNLETRLMSDGLEFNRILYLLSVMVLMNGSSFRFLSATLSSVIVPSRLPLEEHLEI